ncbi:chromatin modification-related protein EAF1 B-like isoform X1 [Actinidia eriantha]|uniref:chromatin modification-related protein EAF1 B-like isoform X1 n=1 Tax=Actinidia eriantha TaxID=165200 RepID=UPI00258B54F9|nr:chromatin modification-related protein EAF1 B-like isoform X1 [Actinidia eriantha]
MHGCSLGSPLLVNAEVDSMGGVIDGGVEIGTKTSPRRAAIEKTQVNLRQEYDVREERRRELEFLERGGNPLDFKFGNATSVSVQSTSLIDQPLEHEAKGSFALATSPHGDSVESSGRPGDPTICEPNCADNLLLLDGESEHFEGERNSLHPTRSNIAPSEQSSRLDESQHAKESGDSASFGLLKNRAYKRRNRSRPNRDGARSSSTDMISSQAGHVSSLPSRHGPKDVKGSVLDTNNQKDQTVASNSRPTNPNGSVALRALLSDGRADRVMDNVQAIDPTDGLNKVGLPERQCDFNASKRLQDNQHTKVGTREISAFATGGPESVRREQVVPTDLDCLPCVATTIAENQNSSGQPNGLKDAKAVRKRILNEGQNSSAAFSMKGLDSESSCTQTSHSLDGNNDSDPCNNLKNVDFNGNTKEKTLVFAGTPHMEADEMLKENNGKNADDIDSYAVIKDEHTSVYQSNQSNGSILRAEENLHGSGSGSQNDVTCRNRIEGVEVDGNTVSETQRKSENTLVDNLNPQEENDCSGRLRSSMDSSARDISNPQKENTCGRVQGSMGPSIPGLSETTLSVKGSADAPKQQACAETHLKLANKAHEDSVLEEARIIEAKRKRIAELSVGTLVSENYRKSHWDFVLEEIAWLANDFAQERLWKITAAARVCHQIASTSRLRFEEQNLECKQKKVAHTLAKAITDFWHSAQETSKEVELQCPRKDFSRAVQEYAVRFLKYNNSHVPLRLAEVPATPDRVSDLGIQEMCWENNFIEENLIYMVPPGAMETYRKSIESHLAQVEKTGVSIQEDVETSIYDDAADNAYEEDEGETSVYYLPRGFEGSNPLKFSQKKRKNLKKSYAAKSYDVGTDSSYMPCMENKVGTQPSLLLGKQLANSLNVGPIPTKRMRTASRQRILGPGAGTSGGVQGPIKTDASSGDTNSFQDDHGILHGSQIPNFEVDSVSGFEKQLPLDSAEVSKPKKKKKAKHLGSPYEQRWQLDNDFQNEQRDHSKRRLDSHRLESNGSSGLFGQHIMKKPKIMRQLLVNSYDNLTPMAGSITSPVASQMSNMSSPNKLIKILAGRDRGRKAKSFKVPAGQSGSGSPWSLFEDQALVVLVHDMGPNWELVSDAINSSLQFKCIYRNPKECKQRHKILMDETADGADSAEDSGSSQPYPSTLPGIPKGSARQLFRQLQGPMEEDMIKTHFEKIIVISQKLHYRRTKNDNQDQKPIQLHNSHTVALSQVYPNNLNGGAPLTPLDLCDTTASSPDVLSLGYQGSHASGIAISNQTTVASVLPSSGANSSLQGSSNMVPGNNFSSPSGAPTASFRDSRYAVPRSASLSIDEQQRMQQCNQMVSSRNIQHSGLSVSGAPPGTNRGIRMLSSGNGMNRSMPMARPMARPGYQGIAPSSMLNSGSMLSSSMAPMPSPVNMHSGANSGQGNSILRPRDALNMMRPVQDPEHQRQMVVPELQMQVSQANSQGVPPFGGLSSALSNQTSTPPVQTYPLHQQQHQISPQQSHVLSNPPHPHLQGPNHASGTQHQVYAIRFAKERQLQQRLLQQQQHHLQFAASNALMQHVQPQFQLPISSSLQNSSQVQPQTSSAPVSLALTQLSSMTPMSQHQQKLHMPPHGLNRNPQTGGNGLTNHMGKQRQRHQQQQSFQQSGRQHPPQRQQSQSQQQGKLIKEVGRGNMLMHQNLTIDPSLLNGLSTTTGGQSAEKVEQAMHLMQGQGLYPGSGQNPVQPSKPLLPHCSNQSHPQQKMYSGQEIPSSKQIQQMPSRSDNSNEGHVSPATSGHTLSASDQSFPSSVIASNHQKLQPYQKLVNQSQPTVQRVFEQNHQHNSDSPSKLQVDQAHTDQQRLSKSSQMSTMEMLESTIDKTTVVPVISSSGAQWRAPDNSVQLATTRTPPLTNATGTEPMPTVSQGQGQGQSSGILPPHWHSGGKEWQHQQSQLQPSSMAPAPPPPPPQLPQQQLQQQTQHLQAGTSSLYIRPVNSRPE